VRRSVYFQKGRKGKRRLPRGGKAAIAYKMALPADSKGGEDTSTTSFRERESSLPFPSHLGKGRNVRFLSAPYHRKGELPLLRIVKGKKKEGADFTSFRRK